MEPDKTCTPFELRLEFRVVRSRRPARLVRSIEETGAQRIIVTHGSMPVMARYLTEQQGLLAEAFDTEYGRDPIEADAPQEEGNA